MKRSFIISLMLLLLMLTAGCQKEDPPCCDRSTGLVYDEILGFNYDDFLMHDEERIISQLETVGSGVQFEERKDEGLYGENSMKEREYYLSEILDSLEFRSHLIFGNLGNGKTCHLISYSKEIQISNQAERDYNSTIHNIYTAIIDKYGDPDDTEESYGCLYDDPDIQTFNKNYAWKTGEYSELVFHVSYSYIEEFLEPVNISIAHLSDEYTKYIVEDEGNIFKWTEEFE